MKSLQAGNAHALPATFTPLACRTVHCTTPARVQAVHPSVDFPVCTEASQTCDSLVPGLAKHVAQSICGAPHFAWNSMTGGLMLAGSPGAHLHHAQRQHRADAVLQREHLLPVACVQARPRHPQRNVQQRHETEELDVRQHHSRQVPCTTLTSEHTAPTALVCAILNCAARTQCYVNINCSWQGISCMTSARPAGWTPASAHLWDSSRWSGRARWRQTAHHRR